MGYRTSVGNRPVLSPARKRRDVNRRKAQDQRWQAQNGPAVRIAPEGKAP